MFPDGRVHKCGLPVFPTISWSTEGWDELKRDEVASIPESRTSQFNVLGVGISPVQIPDVIGYMEAWMGGATLAVSSLSRMHGVTEARMTRRSRNSECADLVVRTACLLYGFARLNGIPLRRRVYGRALDFVLRANPRNGLSPFFLRRGCGVADSLGTAAQSDSWLTLCRNVRASIRPLTIAKTRK